MPTAPYFSLGFRKIVNNTLRPGGLILTDLAMELCRFPRGSRLLDIGCGLGATLDHLSSTYAMNMVGMDLSFQMLGDTKKGSQHSINLAQADGMAIPFRSQSMDGVFCECVLSLMADPLLGLAECRRILRPGGILVVSDLYLRHPCIKENLPAAPRTSCLAGAREKAFLIRMVQASGFTILTWEDHSPYLIQLAADIIFSQEPLDGFLDLKNFSGGRKDAACRSKPGYFLMIAAQNR